MAHTHTHNNKTTTKRNRTCGWWLCTAKKAARHLFAPHTGDNSVKSALKSLTLNIFVSIQGEEKAKWLKEVGRLDNW